MCLDIIRKRIFIYLLKMKFFNSITWAKIQLIASSYDYGYVYVLQKIILAAILKSMHNPIS